MLKPDSYALIIQPGAVGDGILTIPLARLLREQCACDHIDIMGHTEKLAHLSGRTEFERLISLDTVGLHPLFTDSDRFDLPEGDPLIDLFSRYELIVTFLNDEQGHFERNLIYTTYLTHAAEVVAIRLKPHHDYPHHVTQFFLEQFIEQMPERSLALDKGLTASPFVHLHTADHETARELLAQQGLEPYHRPLLLHPGSGGGDKCWPLSNFCRLIECLPEHGFSPVLLLGPAERERLDQKIIADLPQNIPVLRDLALTEVAALLGLCQGYVGNDSGISHLAGVLDIPTLAIFGPSNPCHWRPLGTKVALCQSPDVEQSPWPCVRDVLKTLVQVI